MKLSISNIAWDINQDEFMYQTLHQKGYSGLEIAPTRLLPYPPYNNTQKALNIANALQDYSLSISSIQSIWYGRTENIFHNSDDRNKLLEYTKAAIDFASTLDCHNLVFGCPKNRCISGKKDMETAITFFQELGDYAYSKNTILALEANPTIYNTNFINTTKEAINLIKKVNSKGFLLNLDVGTIICNNEDISVLTNHFDLINHIHISEPQLVPVKKRLLHQQLAELLREHLYDNYISIEMSKIDDNTKLCEILDYVKETFYL